MSKPLIRTPMILTLLALLLYALNTFASKTHEEISARYSLINKVPLSSLDRKIIDILMLGQSDLYDDFVHLWTTQYLGSDEILKIDADVVADEIGKLLHLNIKSESFYIFSCFRFIFNFKRPELCEAIGKAGAKAMPDRWMITAALGYSYLVQSKFSEAAVFFDATSFKEGAPPYFKTVGKKILEKNNFPFSISEEVLKEIESSETTQRIIKKYQQQ